MTETNATTNHGCAAVLTALLTLGLLSGCTTTAENPEPPTVMETLANTETSDYAESRKCLSRFDYGHVEVLGSRHIAFKGPGSRLWVNELRHVCTGLRRNDAVRIERTSGQLCSLDTIEGIERGLGVFDRSGPRCTLGEFHPVTEDQLALMRDTLR